MLCRMMHRYEANFYLNMKNYLLLAWTSAIAIDAENVRSTARERNLIPLNPLLLTVIPPLRYHRSSSQRHAPQSGVPSARQLPNLKNPGNSGASR
jgi:hypothetical protein